MGECGPLQPVKQREEIFVPQCLDSSDVRARTGLQSRCEISARVAAIDPGRRPCHLRVADLAIHEGDYRAIASTIQVRRGPTARSRRALRPLATPRCALEAKFYVVPVRESIAAE